MTNSETSDIAFREAIDDFENRDSQFPADEAVEFHSIWLAECYPPSLIDDLRDHFLRLGWATTEPNRGGVSSSVTEWISQRRWTSEGAAWFSLHSIMRDGDERNWHGHAKIADLPEIVDFAWAGIHHLLPGLFVLVIQFVLKDGPSEQVNRALRDTYTTKTRALEGRTYFDGPIAQKRAAVKSIRQEMKNACADWVRIRLPGAFAREGNPSDFPSSEFVTLLKERPGHIPQGFGLGHYLSILDLDGASGAWESKEYPNIQLRWRTSSRDDEEFCLRLASRRDEAFGTLELERAGGRTRFGLTQRLQYLEFTIATWAIYVLLRFYERRVALMRDEASRLARFTDTNEAISSISALESALLRISSDALTFTTELSDFCGPGGLYGYEVARFLSLETPPPTHTENLEFVRDREGLVPIVRPVETPPGSGPSLFGMLREGMVRGCIWIQQTEGIVRHLVQSEVALANARSQQDVARSNLTLQERVFWLSVTLLVLGAIQLVVTIVQVVASLPIVELLLELIWLTLQ